MIDRSDIADETVDAVVERIEAGSMEATEAAAGLVLAASIIATAYDIDLGVEIEAILGDDFSRPH